jgi:transformation/transcription domain-associated protein
MAKTARKQGLREVAMLSLGKIVDSQLNVSDAFAKLREQILVFNNPDSEQERTGGLNLVNTTNLSFFDAPQKSELFRLKGQFLSSLSARSKANQAYCHAVQICQTYSRAWASWGGLCSSLGRLAEKQHNEQQQQQQQGGSKEKESGNAKKAIQYLAQALGCYLEAIQCDASESSRMHLPKCLWMLSKDGLTPGMLCQHFEARAPNLPCWVWLPWCPQLLTSLYRTEATAVKAILNSLAKTYPQALYFPLRAFYLERRDVDRSKGSSSGTHQGSVLHSEELMSSLRRAHATLWSSLEAILEELIVKFRPSFEEELLSTIAALLDRAESHIESSLNSVDKDSDDEAGILTSISKTLSRISGKYFRDNAPDSTAAKRDMRTRKTEIFKTKYQPIFETDFGTLIGKGEEGKLDLQEFATKLRKWKIMLEEQLASTPVSLPLMESSQSLALFATEAPDLWPMSCDPKAATLLFESERTRDEKTNPSVSSSSAMTAKTASVTAALSVAHSASSEGQGGEYGGGSSSIEIPGQYVPNTVSAIDCRPSPELHAKLVRFDTAVLIVRRSDQLVRKVGMIGSDGRCHKFLLQFGTSSLVRADERTVQLCYVFDKIFRKDNVASRNFLAIYPSPVIPVAQRLRMAPEDDGRLSLDDVFRRRCIEADCQINAISAYRRARVKKLLQARKTDKMTKEEAKEVLASIAKEVLSEICERRVDQHMLLSHVLGTLVSAENLFHFRRTFSSQLAINSLFQYALSVTVRTPAQFVINETTGQVYWPEFRLSYNNQGFLESQKVPFRMTPNVKELVGPMMMEGRFVPSVTMAANALRANMEDIDPVLRLLIRDDIISWYCSKSNAKSDTKTQELEMQLADRVAKNVVLIESKVLECSVKKVDVEQERLPKTPVDQRVRDLVAEASGYERLSEMDSTFHPWL